MDEIRVVDDLAEQAFRRHYAQIYRYVRRRTRDRERAEDLTQEVFAAAAAGLRPGRGPVLAWLYTVARRRFADEARRQARAPVELPTALPGYGANVAAGLRAALGRLPDGQREIVVLKLLRGASFAEIGEAVGIGQDAARMRFSRALRTLRAELEEEGVEP